MLDWTLQHSKLVMIQAHYCFDWALVEVVLDWALPLVMIPAHYCFD